MKKHTKTWRYWKMIVPVLLLATTLFPIYVPERETQAINLYQLIPIIPAALLIPVIFVASLVVVLAGRRRADLYSALLAIFGIAVLIAVNAATNQEASTPEPYSSFAVLLYVIVAPVYYIILLYLGAYRRRQKIVAAIQNAVPKSRPKPTEIHLLAMPLWRFLLLYIISTGIYSAYWAYRNWWAIRESERADISPFWRTIFAVVYTWPLFAKIYAIADARGCKSRYSPTLMATLYVGLQFPVSFAIGMFMRGWWMVAAVMVVTVLTAILLGIVQMTVNEAELKLADGSMKRRLSATEILTIVLGITSLALAYATPPTLSQPPTPNPSPELGALKQQADLLLEHYRECSSSLNARRASLNMNDEVAVGDYNAAVDACDAVRARQNAKADDYNKAIGAPGPR